MMNELEEDLSPTVDLNDVGNEWTYGDIPGFHEQFNDNDNDNV